MNRGRELERSRAFLLRQIREADHKLTRARNALTNCDECLEQQSLQKATDNAQVERDLLNELLHDVETKESLSLDTLIVCHRNRHQKQVRRLGRHWRKGHAIPEEYWSSEIKTHFLERLLRRYHAWEVGRPYYPETGAAKEEMSWPSPRIQRHDYPWYARQVADQSETSHDDVLGNDVSSRERLNRLLNHVQETLHRKGFPKDHLEIIVQPGGSLMVRGVAHDYTQRLDAIDLMLNVPGVCEIVADIQVVQEDRCPICAQALNRFR